MPRSKTGVKRKKIDKQDIETAIKFIQEKKMTIGEASRHFNLKKPTLIFHLNKFKQSGNLIYSYSPKKPKKVFSDEEEQLLLQYLTTAANMHYGLTKSQVMRLAYDFAKANNKVTDPSWIANKSAEKQWLRDYRKNIMISCPFGNLRPQVWLGLLPSTKKLLQLFLITIKRFLSIIHFNPATYGTVTRQD